MNDKKKHRESELRIATVMFADISGFTAMSERMDPEEVSALMNQCFDMMAIVIKQYGGTIDKFIGDSIMILFGVPTAIESAPQKAVNTAIELRNSLYQFNEERKLKIPLDIHIGINTGTVLAGTVGGGEKKDYTVMGDTVNLASRLEDVSESGQILVGPETFRTTRDEFEWREIKSVKLKGIDEEITIYELLSMRERVHREATSGAGRMIQSMMVGRDGELKLLEKSIQGAIDGNGQIINIIGEAGIGKSRLTAELKSKDVMNRVTILEGRAISMGRNLPFYPIIELFKDWAGITEEDSETIAFFKLEDVVRSVHQEGVDEIVPFAATLMGMKLTGRYGERIKGIEGEALEKLILKNVRELLIKATGHTPLVIMIEDLHWADNSSIELLDLLMRLVKTQKIVFINVFRPNFPNTNDRIISTIKEKYLDYYTEITLSPLDENQSEILINNLLNIRGLPHIVKEQVKRRAGGNPFFIEEVVRSFIDEGAVVKKNGGFEVTEKIEEVVIPHTINDVLMTRIDRLDEETRDLLKVASVIGRSFFYRVLIEVAGKVEGMDNRLDYLQEVQFIKERERLEELEYLFIHALAQEVAYESLLIKKRKELHLRVADSIEKVFKGRLHEFYGMLAYHYMKGEDEKKSYKYLERAGEEALKSSASSEALTYYQRALSLYLKKYGERADPGKVANLEKNIALALFNRGLYPDALIYFDRVLTYYGVKTPRHLFSKIMKIIIGFSDFIISLYLPFLKFKKIPTEKDGEIYNLLYKKMSSLAVTDPKMMFIESFYRSKRLTDFDVTKLENGIGMIAAYSFIISYSGLSFRLSRKILEFCRDRVDRNDIKSVIYYELPEFAHNYLKGDWGEIQYDDVLVNRGFGIGEVFHATMYLVFHGHISVDRGEQKDALGLLDKISEVASQYENDLALANHYILNAKLLIKFRYLTDALLTIEEGITFMNKTGSDEYNSLLYAMKARTEILLGDINGAIDSILKAREYLTEALPIPFYSVHISIAELNFDLYRLEESIKMGNRRGSAAVRKSAFKTCIKIIRDARKLAAERTEAYRLIGIYFWFIRRQSKAIKWFDKSIVEGERLGARLELSRTYFEVGKRLIEPESRYKDLNGINAHEYLERARIMFEEMDLKWDLDKLNNINENL